MRLVVWLERWTGLPLTQETAGRVSALRLRATWDRMADDLDRRLDEETRKKA